MDAEVKNSLIGVGVNLLNKLINNMFKKKKKVVKTDADAVRNGK